MENKTIKDRFLDVAEVVDAWRVIPRIFLIIYGLLVYKLYTWFVGIGTAMTTQCDAALIQVLMDRGIDLAQAQSVACTAVDIIGGPTTGQTAFVTTIVGLATAVFAFYANSGRGWGNKKKEIQ